MPKQVELIAEFHGYTGVPRNDGDIMKLSFVTAAHNPAVKKLWDLYGKLVTLTANAGRDGPLVPIGTCAAEFKTLQGSPKTDGDIARLGFIIRAHDPFALSIMPYLRQEMSLQIDEEKGQEDLFEAAAEEDADEGVPEDEPDLGEEEEL